MSTESNRFSPISIISIGVSVVAIFISMYTLFSATIVPTSVSDDTYSAPSSPTSSAMNPSYGVRYELTSWRILPPSRAGGATYYLVHKVTLEDFAGDPRTYGYVVPRGTVLTFLNDGALGKGAFEVGVPSKTYQQPKRFDGRETCRQGTVVAIGRDVDVSKRWLWLTKVT